MDRKFVGAAIGAVGLAVDNIGASVDNAGTLVEGVVAWNRCKRSSCCQCNYYERRLNTLFLWRVF